MAAKGGGAWKVAYADFVTAMMAFFLVMWICGQDQKLRGAVSHYFQDPFDTSKIGTSKQPSRTGSITDLRDFGSVPEENSAALGQGRKPHTAPGEKSPSTKLISAWLSSDSKAMQHWYEKAQATRDWAAGIKDVQEKRISADRAATFQLARLLKNEITSDIALTAQGIQQDLLIEAMAQVNWSELAEDVLAR